MKSPHHARTALIVTLALLMLAPVLAPAADLFFLQNLPVDWMTREDAQMMWASVQQVLEENEDQTTLIWENPETGAGGELTPIGSYTKGEMPCRRLQIFNRAGKDEARWTFGFCKDPQRGWLVDR